MNQSNQIRAPVLANLANYRASSSTKANRYESLISRVFLRGRQTFSASHQCMLFKNQISSKETWPLHFFDRFLNSSYLRDRVKLMLHPIQKVRKNDRVARYWTETGEDGNNFRPGRVLIGPPVQIMKLCD